VAATGTSVCASCHARCCFAYTVPVTGHDVWRIATQLGLGVEQFVVAAGADEHQPNAFRLDRSGRSFMLALDKRLHAERAERACVFWLDLPNGYGRCGIYGARPNVCRTYPAYLRDGAVHIRQDAVCPTGAWSVAGLDIPLWRAELERGELEKRVYEVVVRKWNERVDDGDDVEPIPLGVYYGHLLSVYRRLADIDADKQIEQAEMSPAPGTRGDGAMASIVS
jgi:Fe-S-cluster containining protein